MRFSTNGLEDYLTDVDAEIHGVKVRVSDKLSFLIRRAGGRNAAYDRVLAKHSRPYLRRIRNNAMDTGEFRSRVVLPTYLDAVIIGWEGVLDDDGKPVPFDKKACQEFLETFPNVFDLLVDVASDMSSFREQEDRELVEEVGES